MWPALFAALFTSPSPGCGGNCYTVTDCGKLDLLLLCQGKTDCVASGGAVKRLPRPQPSIYADSRFTVTCRETVPHMCDRMTTDASIEIDLSHLSDRLAAYPRLVVGAEGKMHVTVTIDGDSTICQIDSGRFGPGCLLPPEARSLLVTLSGGYTGTSVSVWVEETTCTLSHEVCDR